MEILFNTVVTSRTIDGEMIAILGLIKPIPEVVGSTGITMKDVTEIKVHHKFFDIVEWDKVKEIGSFIVAGSLVLDVSKPNSRSQSAVWLTDIPFKDRMVAFMKPQSQINEEKFNKFIDGLKQ